MNAVICSHEYQRARSERGRDLTLELASIFKALRRDKEKVEFCYSCQEQVVKPAIELHERLLTSTHHFYLDLNPYVIWNTRQELEMSPDFLDNLPNLKCENILQNRRPFHLAKLDPRPTEEELYRDLTNVVTTVPALYMRQVGKGDVIREPTVVRMQQVLVAWGSQDMREKLFANSQRTLMHRLYYSQREKQEGGVWAQWRNMPWG